VTASDEPVADELIQDEPASYPVEQSTVSFRSGRVIDVRTDLVRFPAGGRALRDVVVHPGAVGVIAVDEQGRVLLVNQYRHAPGRRLWEPPAGLLDEPGEPPLAAVQRELLEETGYSARDWHVLVDGFTSPGMSDEAVRIYLARELTEIGRPAAGKDEELDLPHRWVPLAAAVRAVIAGRIHNPLAVMGLLAAAQVLLPEPVLRGVDQLRSSSTAWPERPPT
jgi:8-oxo-dGTP pyrophosphatase MutT (NUDIX family)